MKKVSLVLLVLMSISSIVEAQDSRFYFGAKIGLSASSFTGDGFEVSKFRTSYQAGMFFGLAIKEWFAIQPELMYDRRGSRQIGELNNGTVQQINVNYFTMPISVKFRAPIKEKFYPHITMGPYWSAKVSQAVGSRTNTLLLDNERLNARRVDFGAFIGAGTDFHFDPFFITMDMRYFFGGINADNSSNVITIRNSQVAVNVGVGFIF